MQKIKFVLLSSIILFPSLLFAQTDAGVKIMPKQGELYENTKKLNNPYFFPVGSKKLGAKGFLLPYPIGVTLSGYMGEQDVTISDLTVGIANADGSDVIPTTSLDGVVGFSDVKASIRNLNMRFDFWAFPFLDVYGIFGKAWVETEVGIGSIMNRPVDISTQANFNGYVYGFGAMLTGGIRSIFFSLDFNKVWTHFDEMAKDNTAINLTPRVGYVFHYQGQPERNISVWTGASRIFLNNETIGSINLSEIAPDMGQNYQNSDWYKQLDQTKQNLANRVVENFVDKNKGDVIHYSLEKRPTSDWCMLLGAQYQANRHWQVRVESNFLGGRKTGLLSASYRFGIK